MPRRLHILLLLVWLLTAAVLPAAAQRRVSPVRTVEPGAAPAPAAETGPDMTRLVHMHDENGNTILVDTVTGQEVPDTTGLLQAPPKMEYPLLYTASVSVNIWDGLMRLLGQRYGIGDLRGELNLHNRYLLSLTAGVGAADLSPSDKNFTFKAPLSPYFKVGADYNFLYNSNPDYKLMFGLRYGFSPFRWSLEDVTVADSYWQDPTTFSLPTTSHTTGWIEISLGIRVRIVDQLSMGWSVIYQSVIHDSSAPHGLPMYIPGFGKRGNPLAASLSITYTFPLPARGKAVAPTAPPPDGDLPPDAAPPSPSPSPIPVTEND